MPTRNTIQIEITASDKASKVLTAVGKKMTEVGTKLTAAVTLPIVALGTASVKMASDLSESMNKVDVVFGDAADSVQSWAKASAQAFGQSSRQALEAAGTFGNLFTSMGMAQEESAKMSKGLVELAGDLASFNNIDPGLALEKLRSGLVGEVEPLRTLGVNINQAVVQAEALRLGLIKAGQEMSAQIAVQARYSLILQQTKNAQGDFARTSDGLANSTRIAKAELENAAAMLGQRLLPIATQLIGVVGDLVGKFTALPDPVMKTVMAIAGIAALAGPVTTAIGGISTALGLIAANPIVAGGAIVIGGLAALVMAIKNNEKAHQDEAIAVLESSSSYVEYIGRLEAANLKAYELSEGLYDLAKAQAGATDDAFVKSLKDSQKEMDYFLDKVDQAFGEGFAWALEGAPELIAESERAIAEMVDGLDDMTLTALQNKATVSKWAQAMGYSADEAKFLTDKIINLTRAEYNGRREAENYASFEQTRARVLTEAMQATDGATGAMVAYARAVDIASKAVEIYNNAAQKAKDIQLAITGTVANSIIELRNMDREASQSAENYADALAQLEADASAAYGGIADKFKASLPDATTVAERMGMAADAWDEWGLRLQDIIQNGVESPWYAALTAMGYAKPPDVGVKEWAAQLKADFYEGELPGLINTGTAAWQEHADQVAAAQADETAAVNAEIGNRRAALEAERAAELAAQQQARQDAIVQMALQVAEESGLLAQWATQRMGALSGVADTADEVWALLQSGMMGLDEGLTGIIGGYTSNLTTMLDTTASQAQETNAELAGIVAGVQTETETGTKAALTEVENTAANTKYVMDDTMGEAEGVVDTAMKNIKNSVESKGDETVKAAEGLSRDIIGAFGNMETNMKKVGGSMLDGIQAGIEENWASFSAWVSNKIVALIQALLAGMLTGGSASGATGGATGGGGATSNGAPIPGNLTVTGDTYYVTVTDRLAAATLLSNVRGRQQQRLAAGMGG
ncbi:MAG: hypothetical protein ABFD92_21110 [Planctomycetaceae bacterium]